MLVKSESNFSILFGLFLSEQTAGTIGTLGGIQDVLAAMRAFPNDAEICANACSALSCLTIHGKDQQTDWQTDKSTQDSGRTRLNPRLYISLLKLENNLTIIREESGVKDLMNAMGTHMKMASVIDSACTAMWGLSLEGRNWEAQNATTAMAGMKYRTHQRGLIHK